MVMRKLVSLQNYEVLLENDRPAYVTRLVFVTPPAMDSCFVLRTASYGLAGDCTLFYVVRDRDRGAVWEGPNSQWMATRSAAMTTKEVHLVHVRAYLDRQLLSLR